MIRSVLIFLIGFLVLASQSLQATAQAQDDDGTRVSAQEICISDYYNPAKTSSRGLGIAAGEAVRLTREIVTRLGTSNQPSVIPCSAIEQAQALVVEDDRRWQEDDYHVPAGEYILYNPSWTRQVIGSDLAQATVLFGHEIGHIINRDFTAQRKELPVIDREKQADDFAGCVAARRGVTLAQVKELLARLRDEVESDHPNRLTSLTMATAGYNRCASERRGDRADQTIRPEVPRKTASVMFAKPIDKLVPLSVASCLFADLKKGGTSRCGQPAADEFCKINGGDKALTYRTVPADEEEVGELLKFLGSGFYANSGLLYENGQAHYEKFTEVNCRGDNPRLVDSANRMGKPVSYLLGPQSLGQTFTIDSPMGGNGPVATCRWGPESGWGLMDCGTSAAEEICRKNGHGKPVGYTTLLAEPGEMMTFLANGVGDTYGSVAAHRKGGGIDSFPVRASKFTQVVCAAK